MRIVKIPSLAAAAAGSFVALASLGLAAGAHAVEVKQEITVPQAASTAWQKIGAFCAIKSWHPAITNCERTRQKLTFFRTLTLKDGGKIREKLTALTKSSYSYTIEESPLPVKNYAATLAIAPAGADKTQSTITWTAKFDAKDKTDAEAKSVIEGIFKAGLDSIKTQVTADAEKAAKAKAERDAKISAAKLAVLEKTAKAKEIFAAKAKQAADAAKAAYEKAKASLQSASTPAAKPAEGAK